MDGWISLYRKMLENPIICKDSDHIAVWIYLLLNVTHKPYDTLFKGERYTLKPGQQLFGRKSISQFLKINENKVQRILKTFENEQQIEQQTTNQNRLISILNWEQYQVSEQQNEQQLNNDRTTTEQRVNTNNNINNNNNTNNIKSNKKVVRKTYGEYKHVKLSDDEFDSLIQEHGEIKIKSYITKVDEYVEQTGKKYKNYKITINNWINREGTKNYNHKKSVTDYKQREYDEPIEGMFFGFNKET